MNDSKYPSQRVVGHVWRPVRGVEKCFEVLECLHETKEPIDYNILKKQPTIFRECKQCVLEQTICEKGMDICFCSKCLNDSGFIVV